MVRRELISLILWLCFCFFIGIESWRLGLGNFKMPGPGFLPFGVALCTGIIALFLLISGIAKATRERPTAFFQGDDTKVRKVIYTVCALFIYPLLLEPLGFFLCTFLFFMFSLAVIDTQKWRLSLGISIAAAIVSYLLFDVFLQLRLPKGIWINMLFLK